MKELICLDAYKILNGKKNVGLLKIFDTKIEFNSSTELEFSDIRKLKFLHSKLEKKNLFLFTIKFLKMQFEYENKKFVIFTDNIDSINKIKIAIEGEKSNKDKVFTSKRL